jgi:putative chitinase
MTDILDQLPAVFRAVAPHVDAAVWAAAFAAPMRSSGLVTPRRAAMLIGQCAEESGGFTVLVENLDYSAEGLRAEWPSHFSPTPGKPAAEFYARQPEKIGNYIYSSACHPDLGNGDEASGDGYAFRGTGPIELTGRALLTRFGAAMGRSPEDAWAWCQTPAGAAASACWYWLQRGQLLALSDAWNIAGLTERINGGETNLNTRITQCNAALRALGGAAPAPTATAADPDDEADQLMGEEQAGTLNIPNQDTSP